MKTIKFEGLNINIITGRELLTVVVDVFKQFSPIKEQLIEFERQATEEQIKDLTISSNRETNLAATQIVENGLNKNMSLESIYGVMSRLSDLWEFLPQQPPEIEIPMVNITAEKTFSNPALFVLIGVEYQGNGNLQIPTMPFSN